MLIMKLINYANVFGRGLHTDRQDSTKLYCRIAYGLVRGSNFFNPTEPGAWHYRRGPNPVHRPADMASEDCLYNAERILHTVGM